MRNILQIKCLTRLISTNQRNSFSAPIRLQTQGHYIRYKYQQIY